MPLVTDSNRSVSFFFGLGVGSIDVCVERNAMEWGIGDDYTFGTLSGWAINSVYTMNREGTNMAVAISNFRRCDVRIE